MGVSREHYAALASYESYSLAWLAPIFYPLALACVAQALVIVDIVRRRSGRSFLPVPWLLRKHFQDKQQIRIDPRLDAVVGSILVAEFVFAWACIVQCITNYSASRFMGTSRACDVQAFYATYYVFSAIGLAAFGILVGYHVIATGRASLFRPALSSSAGAEGSGADGRGGVLLQLLPGLLIHALATVIASLPLFGLKGYMFATDYCMFNIEAPLFCTIFLSYFGLCVAAVAYSLCRTAAKTAGEGGARRTALKLLVGTSCYLAVAWITTCVIAFLWMCNGEVYDSEEWRIYGAQAIILHSNQLFTPVLFGWLWRYCMQAVLDEGGLPSAVNA